MTLILGFEAVQQCKGFYGGATRCVCGTAEFGGSEAVLILAFRAVPCALHLGWLIPMAVEHCHTV